MNKCLLCLLVMPLFWIGCASAPYPTKIGNNPWYEELNPGNDELPSDWTLIDGDRETLSDRNYTLTDMGHTVNELILEAN